MTILLAVAAGRAAADALVDLVRRRVDDRAIYVRHENQVVAWSTTSPWIDVHDDGDVLAVVDGRLHGRISPDGAAHGVADRYRRLGQDTCCDLWGDYVVVVLDRRARVLLVGRDPVGVRPWYQATSGQRHAGASNVATLAALRWVDTSVDEPIAIEYLAGIPQSRGRTVHAGIATLQPGHTCIAARHGVKTYAHHRWQVDPRPRLSWEEAAERCVVLLDDAVRARLDTGSSATSEVSGGLDSSTVAGTLVVLGRSDVLGGRLLFTGAGADERRYSDAVSAHWGIPLVSVPPWQPDEAEYAHQARELRRPPPEPNFAMFVTLHKALLAEGRRDAFTGLGGDDAFVAARPGSRVVSAFQLRRWDILRDYFGKLRAPRTFWHDVARPALGYVSPVHHDARPRWVSPRAAVRGNLNRIIHERARVVTGVAAVDERLSGMTSGYNASILEDRAVVNDLTGRRETHPFLDPLFVEGVYGLNPWWPMRGGHGRAMHVAAFTDRLPASVAKRRTKAEFSEVVWRPLLTPSATASVRRGPLRELGWLDDAGFLDVVNAAREGRATAALPLSRCILLDQWLRHG